MIDHLMCEECRLYFPTSMLTAIRDKESMLTAIRDKESVDKLRWKQVCERCREKIEGWERLRRG